MALRVTEAAYHPSDATRLAGGPGPEPALDIDPARRRQDTRYRQSRNESRAALVEQGGTLLDASMGFRADE